jgi:hypothetical protein
VRLVVSYRERCGPAQFRHSDTTETRGDPLGQRFDRVTYVVDGVQGRAQLSCQRRSSGRLSSHATIPLGARTGLPHGPAQDHHQQ